MNKKVFFPPLAIVLLVLSFPPLAQPTSRIPRIGMLRSGSSQDPYGAAFQQGLRDFGYLEGKNIVIEYRYAEGKPERLPDLAAELVRLKVDLVITSGEAAGQAAKQAIQTIPIVMANHGDPVGSGLITSLARPGGNITGLSALSPELSGKALELLKETLPKMSRVGILWNPANSAKLLDFKEAQVAAKSLKVQLQSLEVRGPDDFDSAFGAAMRERSEALSVRADAVVTIVHRQRIVDFAIKNRLPTVFELREFSDAGGLMSYGPDVGANFRRAAFYIDKILKGAKPADLPVEQPTKFELVINLTTAKQIGLAIPPNVLARADKVIR